MYLDQIEASIKKHHYQSTMEYMLGPNGVNIPNTLVIKKENRIVATIDMQHTGHIEINTLLNQALTMKLIKFSRTDGTARIKTVHLTLKLPDADYEAFKSLNLAFNNINKHRQKLKLTPAQQYIINHLKRQLNHYATTRGEKEDQDDD